MKSKREREEPCSICGHYHDYEGGEQCSVCGHVLPSDPQTSTSSSAYPTEILPGFLYLGSYDNAARSELLKALDITHILNLVPNFTELYRNSFTYHTVKSKPPDYEECFAFIDSVHQQHKRVLVHCMSGASKSPGVVVAYLMKLREWSLSESYQWVTERHRSTRITSEEAERLQKLELVVRGKSSTGYQPGQEPLQLTAATSGEQSGVASSGPFHWSSCRDAPVPPSGVFQPTMNASLAFSQDAATNGFVFGAQKRSSCSAMES